MKQNEKLNQNLAVKSYELEKYDSFPSLSTKYTLPSDKDFSKLMENINNIINPKTTNYSVVINENENVEAGIEEGQIKYFRIIVKQKKSPVAITIQRKTGKVLIYTSSTCYEPGVKNYEKCFATDYIEIKDKGSHFKYEVLHLGIKGIIQSFIRISVSFGKGIKNLEELKRIRRGLTKDLTLSLSPDKDYEDDKKQCVSVKRLKNDKDFIEKNKILSSENLTTKALVLKNRGIS